MTNTNKSPAKEKWFDTDIVVEVLIGEVSSKPGDAPAIASLCVGFHSLSKEKLGEEIEKLRDWKPRIFPKSISTEKILSIIEKKYQGYVNV